MQIVVLKSFCRHFRYIAIWVFVWVIKQVHFHIPQELFIFDKHYDGGNFQMMS